MATTSWLSLSSWRMRNISARRATQYARMAMTHYFKNQMAHRENSQNRTDS